MLSNSLSLVTRGSLSASLLSAASLVLAFASLMLVDRKFPRSKGR